MSDGYVSILINLIVKKDDRMANEAVDLLAKWVLDEALSFHFVGQPSHELECILRKDLHECFEPLGKVLKSGPSWTVQPSIKNGLINVLNRFSI